MKYTVKAAAAADRLMMTLPAAAADGSAVGPMVGPMVESKAGFTYTVGADDDHFAHWVGSKSGGAS